MGLEFFCGFSEWLVHWLGFSGIFFSDVGGKYLPCKSLWICPPEPRCAMAGGAGCPQLFHL